MTNKQFITLTALLGLLLALAVWIGANVSRTAHPLPERWQSGEFIFPKNALDMQLQFHLNSPNPNTLSTVAEAPEIVSDADYVLTRIGNDGWRLAWSDGTRYLVQRPAGSRWRTAYFIVFQRDAGPK